MKRIRSIPRRYRVLGSVLAAGALVAGFGATIQAVQAAPSASSAVACSGGTTVQTTNGPVCGVINGGVGEWEGIPYAAPPVGSLRWQPPQAPASWTTTLNATSFANECIQTSPDQGGVSVPGSSEDCLYVNVWAPQSAFAGENLPVMVHIHGGGFYAGNGNADNSLLATTGNEVIVSMNYRLGIFGFLANSTLSAHSGDYGLQDQQAALRWVQANVSKFGGNPRKVTIFGESAGGSSVCDQIASPTAKGLFKNAISTSGEYNTLLGRVSRLDRTAPKISSRRTASRRCRPRPRPTVPARTSPRLWAVVPEPSTSPRACVRGVLDRVESRVVALRFDVANLRSSDEACDAAQLDRDDLVVVTIDHRRFRRQTADRLGQPPFAHRLEDVVDGLQLERVHCPVVVRGDEHDARRMPELREHLGEFDAVQSRHLDVAEDRVDRLAVEHLQCARRRGCAAHGPDPRVLTQQIGQLVACRGFVVDDKGAQAQLVAAGHDAPRSVTPGANFGIRTLTLVPRSGAVSTTMP